MARKQPRQQVLHALDGKLLREGKVPASAFVVILPRAISTQRLGKQASGNQGRQPVFPTNRFARRYLRELCQALKPGTLPSGHTGAPDTPGAGAVGLKTILVDPLGRGGRVRFASAPPPRPSHLVARPSVQESRRRKDWAETRNARESRRNCGRPTASVRDPRRPSRSAAAAAARNAAAAGER